jgi:apolipoprotein N-acyltransferase
MYIITKDKIIDVYDKTKLLPFGEYLPLRRFIPSIILRLLGNGLWSGTDGIAGEMREIMIGKYAVLPRICSESFFKYEVKNARWIVQILNDGWFGNSIKAQHLAIDRLRVAQVRLPMVRVSNNGISAVIDRSGRVTIKLKTNHRISKSVTIDLGS